MLSNYTHILVVPDKIATTFSRVESFFENLDPTIRTELLPLVLKMNKLIDKNIQGSLVVSNNLLLRLYIEHLIMNLLDIQYDFYRHLNRWEELRILDKLGEQSDTTHDKVFKNFTARYNKRLLDDPNKRKLIK